MGNGSTGKSLNDRVMFFNISVIGLVVYLTLECGLAPDVWIPDVVYAKRSDSVRHYLEK